MGIPPRRVQIAKGNCSHATSCYSVLVLKKYRTPNMLRTIPLPNKLLCITEFKKCLYIGDSHGIIYSIQSPFLSPQGLLRAPGPVSSIVFLDDEMYFGTWDGIVYSARGERKLGSNPVKCMSIYRNRLFISVESRLFVLDKDLNVLEKYDTENKIYCMDLVQGKLYFGLGIGLVAAYENSYEPAYKSKHETTILCMKGDLTGSVDSTLRKQGELLFSGNGWIRSIWDQNLFTCGKSVFESGSLLYSHRDEVVGILKIEGRIISIGLDYCYKVFEENEILSSTEEMQLMKILDS